MQHLPAMTKDKSLKLSTVCPSVPQRFCIFRRCVGEQTNPRAGLIGAGGDGFVQLKLQRRSWGLQAAVTRLTHPAGLKQLLTWHRDLLITTTGTENIPTVPAGGDRERNFRKMKMWKEEIERVGGWWEKAKLYQISFMPNYTCSCCSPRLAC